MPVRAGDLRAGQNARRRVDAATRQSPRHRRDVGCSFGAETGRAEALPRVLEGRGHRRSDWEPKQFLDSISLKSVDSASAVAAGARLARVVRGQNRRDRAATCRARVFFYLPSELCIIYAIRALSFGYSSHESSWKSPPAA